MNPATLLLVQSITFFPVQETDFEQLNIWVRTPHVAKWWYPDVLPWDQFLEKYRKNLNSNSVWGYIIQVDGKSIGFIQAYDAHEIKGEDGIGDPVGTYGMDLYIADTDYLGKGYGTAVLQKFMEKMKSEHAVRKFIIDPDVNNVAAIKTYTKVGFKPVKEVTSEKLGNLLVMELMVGETANNNA